MAAGLFAVCGQKAEGRCKITRDKRPNPKRPSDSDTKSTDFGLPNGLMDVRLAALTPHKKIKFQLCLMIVEFQQEGKYDPHFHICPL